MIFFSFLRLFFMIKVFRKKIRSIFKTQMFNDPVPRKTLGDRSTERSSLKLWDMFLNFIYFEKSKKKSGTTVSRLGLRNHFTARFYRTKDLNFERSLNSFDIVKNCIFISLVGRSTWSTQYLCYYQMLDLILHHYN